MSKEVIIRVATVEDIASIRSISENTWPSTYGNIISKEQIDFMLDWMYSDASLEKQMNTGHEFYLAIMQNEPIGFCSVSPASEDDLSTDTNSDSSKDFKLNKLYVLPSIQKTGAGSALLNKALEVAKSKGAKSIYLQVNKLNKAVNYYLKKGFIMDRACKFDIGNGYFMDDYILRYKF